MPSPSRPPTIPIRTSSKRAFESAIQADQAAKRSVEDKIKEETKKIKLQGSFNAVYWSHQKAVSDLQLERHSLVRKISKAEFELQGGEETQWEQDQKAILLREEKSSLELKNRLLEQQLVGMGFHGTNESQQHRQWIMELISAQPINKGGCGVGKEVGQGQRDSEKQSEFRDNLIKACDSKNKDERADELWCPIIGLDVIPQNCHAAHIFPYASGGQLAMDEIFGRPDGKDELMSIENGLIMSCEAEKRLANGWMVLIPDLPETASTEQLDAWAVSEPKAYKIRVLDSKPKEMTMFLPVGCALHQPSGRRRCWWELDNQSVQFSSRHRPRARYLYWQFAVALLRQAYQSRHPEANPVAAEFGKRFCWGTGGQWIRRKYLLGFGEVLGYGFPWENLLEAATDGEGDCEADPAGVLQASKQIDWVREKMENGWPECGWGVGEDGEDVEDEEDRVDEEEDEESEEEVESHDQTQ
ncbi:MAG: hypothetical protein Q9202_005813 [Teloschistes flavicans]